MQITDRAKDVIKSGGEWISSIEIENIAAGHPKAAAGRGDRRRPSEVGRAAAAAGEAEGPARRATREEFLAFLDGKIAKWWMPDDVVFVDEIPLGATGKIDKKLIRQRIGRLRPADRRRCGSVAPYSAAAGRSASDASACRAAT